jgi:hypothetical protein
MAFLATLMLAATAASSACAAALPSPQPVAFSLSRVATTGALLRGVAGQVLHGEVLVRNTSGRPVTVLLQAADILNSSNGNAEYVTAHLSQTGRWLRLATSRVRLAPQASREVAFTVRIPARARGASHYAGIVATNAAQVTAAAAGDKNRRRPSFTFYRIDRQALPITIRLRGRLSRRLVLRSARIVVAPVGAGLVLGLLPGGSELIEGARIRLRIQRRGRTLFTYVSTLGQLFPGSPLNYRIPWKGQPTPGTYHLQGVIRPQGAAVVNINRTVEFTAAKAARLEHEATPGAGQSTPGMPGWVWPALAAAAVLLTALSVAVWKLARRTVQPVV